MAFRYAVLGAGRQGVAAAYDLARFGDASEVIVADAVLATSEHTAEHVNNLIGRKVARPIAVDAGDVQGVVRALEGVNAFVAAAHYTFNVGLTGAAIRLRAHMVDLGGHTETVLEQRRSSAQAAEAGVTVVPDCGMGPGMNVSLAMYAMSLVEQPREVLIWDGGLPQDPQPPWNYISTFSLDGLINEYDGDASFLRDGRVTAVPAFDGYEIVEFDEPLGRLEAFVTSGGLSTAPWTLQGKLQRLENKTLRYVGHCERFRAFAELGLHGTEPVLVDGHLVVPREVYKALLEAHITSEGPVRDVAVMRVKAIGQLAGRPQQAVIELIDRFDEATGFSAMQRLTGWHASIVAILAAKGGLPKGVVSVESIPGATIVAEARKRGFVITEKVG